MINTMAKEAKKPTSLCREKSLDKALDLSSTLWNVFSESTKIHMLCIVVPTMKGNRVRLRTEVDGIQSSVSCKRLKKSREFYNQDLYTTSFSIDRPSKVMESTMQAVSYLQRRYSEKLDVVSHKRKIPLPDERNGTRHRLMWLRFTECVVTPDLPEIRYKELFQNWTGNTNCKFSHELDPTHPVIIMILETPCFDGEKAGTPALMGSGDSLGHWKKRHDAIQFDKNLFMIIFNGSIAEGTEYKFVFHNIPDGGNEDQTYPAVSTDIPGDTCNRNFRWEHKALKNRKFDVQVKPNEITYLCHYWGARKKTVKVCKWQSKVINLTRCPEITSPSSGISEPLDVNMRIHNYVIEKSQCLDLSRPVYVFVLETPPMDSDGWNACIMGSNEQFGNWKNICLTANSLGQNFFILIVNEEIAEGLLYKWTMYKKALLKDRDAVLKELEWEPEILQNRVFPAMDFHGNWEKSFIVLKQRWGNTQEQNYAIWNWQESRASHQVRHQQTVICPTSSVPTHVDLQDLKIQKVENYIMDQKQGLDLSCPVYMFVLETPVMDLDIWSASIMGSDKLLGNWRDICVTAQALDPNLFIVIVNDKITDGGTYKWITYKKTLREDENAVLAEMEWESDFQQDRLFPAIQYHINWNKYFVFLKQTWGNIHDQDYTICAWKESDVKDTVEQPKPKRRLRAPASVDKGSPDIVGSLFARSVFKPSALNDMAVIERIEGYLTAEKNDLNLSRPVYVFVVETPAIDLDIWSTSVMGSQALFGNWKQICWTAKPLGQNFFMILVNHKIPKELEYKWIMYKKELLQDQDAALQEMKWETQNLQNRIFPTIEDEVNWGKSFVLLEQTWENIDEQNYAVFDWVDLYKTSLTKFKQDTEEHFSPAAVAKKIGQDLYDIVISGRGEQLLQSINAALKMKSKEVDTVDVFNKTIVGAISEDDTYTTDGCADDKLSGEFVVFESKCKASDIDISKAIAVDRVGNEIKDVRNEGNIDKLAGIGVALEIQLATPDLIVNQPTLTDAVLKDSGVVIVNEIGALDSNPGDALKTVDNESIPKKDTHSGRTQKNARTSCDADESDKQGLVPSVDKAASDDNDNNIEDNKGQFLYLNKKEHQGMVGPNENIESRLNSSINIIDVAEKTENNCCDRAERNTDDKDKSYILPDVQKDGELNIYKNNEESDKNANNTKSTGNKENGVQVFCDKEIEDSKCLTWRCDNNDIDNELNTNRNHSSSVESVWDHDEFTEFAADNRGGYHQMSKDNIRSCTMEETADYCNPLDLDGDSSDGIDTNSLEFTGEYSKQQGLSCRKKSRSSRLKTALLRPARLFRKQIQKVFLFARTQN